jgi:hypothetical protein
MSLDLTVPANLNNVNGKTILITGGASGLGEGMFRRFAAHGCVYPQTKYPSGSRTKSRAENL